MEENDSILRGHQTNDAFARLFPYQDKPLSDEIMEAITAKKTFKKPRIFPFVNIDDLNNQNENDDNRPKRALVIGIKGEF